MAISEGQNLPKLRQLAFAPATFQSLHSPDFLISQSVSTDTASFRGFCSHFRLLDNVLCACGVTYYLLNIKVPRRQEGSFLGSDANETEQGQAGSLHSGERNSKGQEERNTWVAGEGRRRKRRKGGEWTKMHSPIKNRKRNKPSDHIKNYQPLWYESELFLRRLHLT